jgi:hypothetical protein
VPAAPVAAGAAIGQVAGGEHEQPAGRVEVARLAGRERGGVCRERRRPPRRVGRQARRVRPGERARREGPAPGS